MLSAIERRRLVEAYEREPIEIVATAIKCSVCIAFIGAIAFIGYRTDLSADQVDGRAPHATGAAIAQNTMRSDEHGAGVAVPDAATHHVAIGATSASRQELPAR